MFGLVISQSTHERAVKRLEEALKLTRDELRSERLRCQDLIDSNSAIHKRLDAVMAEHDNYHEIVEKLQVERERRIAIDAILKAKDEMIAVLQEQLAVANLDRKEAVSQRLSSLDLVNSQLMKTVVPEVDKPLDKRPSIIPKPMGSRYKRADRQFYADVLSLVNPKKEESAA